MALVLKDRVRETTTTTGTGAVTLAGPFSGFQPFSVIGDGNTTYYAISDPNTGAWEVGVGTYTLSGNTLSRDTVLESSNSGSLVNFAAGSKDVILTQPAERAVYLDTATSTSLPGVNLPNLTASTALALDSSKNIVSVTNTGTGNNVLATSPVLTTPNLGTPSALTLTNATGLPVSTGISGLGAGVATFLATPSSANLAAAVTGETGSGALVFATSPSLTTPTLGVASATSINKVAITAPATSATLTIADGKTLTANNSLTLAGTDATTMTFPATSTTVAGLSIAQTFSAAQTFSSTVTMSGTTTNIALGTSQTTGTWTAGGTTQTGALTLGQSTGAQTVNLATGATTNGTTKTVNLGTAGVSGSTTTINIGSAVSGSTTNLTINGNATFSSTTAVTISKGTTAQQPGSPTTGMIRYNTSTNQFEGYSGSTPAWKSIGGSTLSNDTSTASDLYPVFSNATSGTAENLYTSNAKLLYKPSTGELQASAIEALNGIVVNSATVNTSYTIPTGANAMSAGPVTVASGVTVTVGSGSRYVVV